MAKKAVAAQRLFGLKALHIRPILSNPFTCLFPSLNEGTFGAVLATRAGRPIPLSANRTPPISFFCRIQRLLQITVVGKNCIPKPLTKDGVRDPLRADIAEGPIQNQAASLIVITAALFYQFPCFPKLILIHPCNLSHG